MINIAAIYSKSWIAKRKSKRQSDILFHKLCVVNCRTEVTEWTQKVASCKETLEIYYPTFPSSSLPQPLEIHTKRGYLSRSHWLSAGHFNISKQ